MSKFKLIEGKSFQASFGIIRDIVIMIGVVISLVSIQDVAQQTKLTAEQTKLNTEQTILSKAVASAQYVDTINQRLKDPKFDKITNAIEGNDDAHPDTFKVWDQYGGQFTYNDITNYIDNYDEVGNLYTSNLIDKKMAYTEFSYDAEKAWCNNDIRKLVETDRQTDGSNRYKDYRKDWWGFEQLATISLQIDKKDCSALNNE